MFWRKTDVAETDDFDYEKGTEIFRTERCLVREIRLSDLPALYRIYDEPDITDHMEPLYEWDEEVEYTKTYIRMIYGFYGYGMWVVCDKKTGELIGRVGFDDREIPDGKGGMRRILELGYVITTRLQRQGYATEVCRAAIRYMEKEFGEDTFTSLIEPENDGSIRFAEKLGFVAAGDVIVSQKDMLVYERKSAQKTD